MEKSILFTLYLNAEITDVNIELDNVFQIGIILLQKEYFNMLVFANETHFNGMTSSIIIHKEHTQIDHKVM